MTQTLFNNNENAQEPNSQNQNTDPNHSSENNDQVTQQQQDQIDALEELVGEGKKFKTVNDLARGKKEADDYIEQLKSELSGLREDLDKRMTAQEILEAIKGESNSSSNSDDSGENTTPSLSKNEIADLVKQTLEESRTEEQETNNVLEVDRQIKDKFGEKAQDWLKNKAGELGVSVSFLESVAKSSPTAFYNTVGLNAEREGGQHITTGSVNSGALSANPVGSGPEEGTYKYYQKMRKEDPRKYWSAEIQNEIFRKRKELGPEKFWK